jgi:hypothetical protein
MSTQELRIVNEGIVWLTWIVEGNKIKVIEGDGRSWKIDRNQAHLLMLYL